MRNFLTLVRANGDSSCKLRRELGASALLDKESSEGERERYIVRFRESALESEKYSETTREIEA